MNGMTQVRLVDTPEYLDEGLWWPWCSLSGITAFTLVTIPPFICLFRSDDMIDVVRERSRISNLISSKEWKAQVSIWVFLFSFNDWDFFFSLALFTRLTYLGGRGGFWHLPGFLLSHAARDSNSLIASSIITIMIIPRESSSSNSSELSQEYQRKSTLCSHFA